MLIKWSDIKKMIVVQRFAENGQNFECPAITSGSARVLLVV